jgi:hypothetical protein
MEYRPDIAMVNLVQRNQLHVPSDIIDTAADQEITK